MCESTEMSRQEKELNQDARHGLLGRLCSFNLISAVQGTSRLDDDM